MPLDLHVEVKYKGPVVHDPICVSDSICMKYLEWANPWRQTVGEQLSGGVLADAYRVSFGAVGMFLFPALLWHN